MPVLGGSPPATSYVLAAIDSTTVSLSCARLQADANLLGIIALGRSEQETKARDDGSARHNAGVHGRQPSFDGLQHERVHSRSLMSGVARDRASDALALRCAALVAVADPFGRPGRTRDGRPEPGEHTPPSHSWWCLVLLRMSFACIAYTRRENNGTRQQIEDRQC